MPARRTTTTLEKTKKNILNTTNTSNYTDDKDDEKTRPKKGEKKKQKSQQKQQHVLSQEKKNVQKSSLSKSSSLYSKDPLKTLQTSEEDKEEFVNFLLKEEE